MNSYLLNALKRRLVFAKPLQSEQENNHLLCSCKAGYLFALSLSILSDSTNSFDYIGEQIFQKEAQEK